ncbi:protein kinase domain-containing protein [Actinomadura citrea]|uniref:protein kinase domain-containing protein n=1 Tax=Actinomadura citrea TaxID=46158 RepID=UPI003CE49B21
MERAVLVGRYRLDKRLGGGGMGEVWRGFDQVLGRRVAVKLIHAELRNDAGMAGQALSRFRREATAAAGLNHRNITTVHDFGEHAYADRDGRIRLFPFLVLEFLEGSDLGSLLEQAPAGLPVDEVLDWGVQTCEGLAVAHRAGVVHRDIKPANLMLLPDGTVKICDFGIARLPDATAGLTGCGAPMGTRGYMAPEQERGRSVDSRADLYALGMTLYRLFTGSDGPPRAHRAGNGADLDDLMAALLAETPEQRPASAEEVAERLRAISQRIAGQRHVRGLSPPPLPERPRDAPEAGTRLEERALPRPHRMWPVPRQLPAPSAVFVGRQDALTTLTGLLPDDGEYQAVVISAIAGGAGIGKTTLAVHWAHQIADRFPDGALFVNLRGYDPAEPLSPLQALDGFLRALDVPATKIPAELHARSALFRSMLAGRRVLVVLDNAADAEHVRPLLPGTPGCLALVTSRSYLAGLTTREGAHRVSLDVLSPEQAVALLRRTVGVDRVDAEPEQAHELARRCGHLPLALRIAAERAASNPHLRLADLVAELADEPRRLDALTTSDDPTTAVRAVFSWSYNRLPEPAARAFSLLGLNAGPDISLQAAAALFGSSVLQAQRLLDTLTGQHLLQHSGRNRYRYHDLLRDYAAERANQDQSPHSRDQAIRRLLTWYLHTAYNGRNALIPNKWQMTLEKARGNEPPPASFTSTGQALEWFDEERVNLVAAVCQAADSGHETAAWKLACTLHAFLSLRWHPDDWRTVLDTGLAAAQHQRDKTGQAQVLVTQGERLYNLGCYEEAIKVAKKALSLRRQIDDRGSKGGCHNVIGLACTKLGEFNAAVEHLKQALLDFQAISYRRGEGIALHNLGPAHLGRGDLHDAIDCSRRAAAIFQETGNLDSYAGALRRLGNSYRSNRQHDEAIRYYRESIAALRGTPFARWNGEPLVDLGELYLVTGQVDRGRKCLQEALTILAPLDHPRVPEIRSLLAAAKSASGPTTP